MKIAFLNQPWSRVAVPMRKADSVAIWTYEVARRVAREHEVVVYGRRFPGQARAESREGVIYRRVDLARPLAWLQDVLVTRGLSPVGRGSDLYHLSYACQAALSLRDEPCDIVHIHNLSHFVPVIRFFNPQTRVVLHMHCEWMSQIHRRKARERLEQVERVVGCSHHVAERIERRFPQLAARCGVLHNGAELGFFGGVPEGQDPPVDGGVILFVGRITPEKGIHDLLEAFALVLKERPNAELRLIGPHEPTPAEFIVRLSHDSRVKDLARFYPGNYLEQLQRLVPPEVLARVRFVGEVDRTALATAFHDAHVLANPSLSEAFGMSLVEAMASRVPVVATNVGGMRSIVEDGETGLLVPPADPRGLADGLLRVLRDRELRRKLIERGRDSVERRFSWDAVAREACAHYVSVHRANAGHETVLEAV